MNITGFVSTNYRFLPAKIYFRPEIHSKRLTFNRIVANNRWKLVFSMNLQFGSTSGNYLRKLMAVVCK